MAGLDAGCADAGRAMTIAGLDAPTIAGFRATPAGEGSAGLDAGCTIAGFAAG